MKAGMAHAAQPELVRESPSPVDFSALLRGVEFDRWAAPEPPQRPIEQRRADASAPDVGMNEEHGSRGQMAVDLDCKTWLAGGRQVANKKTWFAHLPRTQKGFSWPYPNPASAQEKARKHSKRFMKIVCPNPAKPGLKMKRSKNCSLRLKRKDSGYLMLDT